MMANRIVTSLTHDPSTPQVGPAMYYETRQKYKA